MPGLIARPRPSGPLTLDEAAALLAPLQVADRVLIAVSGGPDSTALMHLAAMVRDAGLLPPLVVATLDHGFHPASAEVAGRVVGAARLLGLEAHLLHWTGPKPSAGIQEAARRKRYELLTGLAQVIGASHLLTAHTLDDQAETILFRLASGSGPAGLIGMRSPVGLGDLIHMRPFLQVSKVRLLETCRVQGWHFVEDVANRDQRFARTRLRALLPRLAEEGLDADVFATLARRLARDDAALRAAAATLLGAATLTIEPARRTFDAAALLEAPPAVGVRAFGSAMTDFARAGSPGLGPLERLYDHFRFICTEPGSSTVRRTLHGHIVALRGGKVLDIRPEGPRRRGFSPGKAAPR